MLSLLKKLFSGKQEETKVEEAPYKVEAPTPVAEQATQAVVESIASAPAKKKPAPKKAPAKKAPVAKTPRALKAPKK